MPAARNYLYDGCVSLEGGVDSGRSPSIIAANQAAWAVNVTFRGGWAVNRPGFKQQTLVFNGATDAASDALRASFEDGLFQGAGVLNTATGQTYVCVSISGSLYRIKVSGSNEVDDVSGTDTNSPVLPLAWFCQAEDVLVIQDGQSKPWLYDGATIRRAADEEVPVGTAMAYGIGRLWVARGNQYFGGDLVYSDPAYGRRTVLRFTENTFLNEGGAFSVPSNLGDITALSFVAKPDTAQGLGSLLVFTKGAILEFDAPVDRDVWKALDQPLQKFALLGFGATSQNGVVAVNGDLFFRAQDGIRSFYFARRDFGGWGNTPISNEVERVQQHDDPRLLGRSSSVNFDNRMLMTIQPQLHAQGVYHNGLAVLDFDLVSGMRDKQPPAWEGVWTGIRVLQVLTATVNHVQRCYAFVLGAGDKIELWELTKNGRFDNEDTRIASMVEFRSMNCQGPFVPKRLESGDLALDSIAGTVDFTVRWRPDLHPCWQEWHTWKDCAEYQFCDTEGDDSCKTVPNFRENEINRRGLPQPPDTADEANCTLYRNGYEFQTRIEWTGRARIKRFRIRAQVLPDSDFGGVKECCD